MLGEPLRSYIKPYGFMITGDYPVNIREYCKNTGRYESLLFNIKIINYKWRAVMARSIKSLEEVKIPETYSVENAEYIKETESFALTLRHKYSNARVLVLSNEDDNKVFNIGFRTPPEDDTGVPHIIEHTVLCGSKNFPVKDPFVELVKGSLNTFLNATTYPDKTLYPVASCNNKDFENLMHVYMDAVFYPNIYKYEEIFKQEGWHYELADKDSPLIYNGVVYNEMKGAYSSEERVLDCFVMSSLFPDTTYHYESGGDPKCIPDLTYEAYLDFHKKYYHPSNSYIYLYGDMDIEERLIWMDKNYLKDFKAIKTDSEIGLQPHFDSIKSLTKTYAAGTDTDCTEKTYYAYAAAMDITMEQEKCLAFELLSYVLVEMPGAPVKKALLDAGIGTDIDVDFCDIMLQSYFTITTKNAKAGDKERFYRVIIDTLEGIVKDGIDKKTLEAALNGMEFREREADFGSYPKGLIYSLKALKTWLYSDSEPYSALKYEQYYGFLREQIHTDYFEKLVQEFILNNTHAVLVEMIPEKGLAIKNEQELEEKLETFKAGLSDKEKDMIIQQTKDLKAYQEEPSPKEDLEKIPMLAREDIRKDAAPYYNTETKICSIPTVHHDIASNGIIYLNFFFDIHHLKEYVPQISFLSTLLGYMDTENYTYNEFDTEVNFYTGGIAADTDIYTHLGRSDEYELKFEVRTKVLEAKVADALRLMDEMMFKTIFTDEKHLREVVAESRSRLKVRLMSAGNQAAAVRVNACNSESAWLIDYSAGIGYYDYLVRLDENFDEEKENLIKGCKALVKEIFKKEKLLISCTCKEEALDKLKEAMPSFIEGLGRFECAGQDVGIDILKKYTPDIIMKKEAFTTPAEIQYVALGGTFDSVKDANFGVLNVVQHLLNYDYLWNQVRVKGGAYGVKCNFTREKQWYFASYRDPNLSSTINVYESAPDYLEHFNADEREVTKTIIGAISNIDTPLTPNMKGNRSMTAYFKKVPYDVLQKERDSILACSIGDIRKSAEVIREVAAKGNICVIGNEKHIKDEKDIFDEIKVLS